MGSLKALQEWCRIQCENYRDVEIKNMSASFRDGMAFCAIIHKHRPDLIDFDSLSKHNVYDNNRLAFETAESELGIPALLDPEDMVSMKVPDRLSIITYVSQYYNYFTNKSQAATRPSLKIPGHTVQNKLAIKSNDQVPESKKSADDQSKRKALSSTCAACQKHVHLVQRHLVDGKLYHRNCFRCAECSSTLIPGSYKLGSEAGSLVCTHHFNGRNSRPDLSKLKGPMAGLGGRASPPETPPTTRGQEKAPPQSVASEETSLCPDSDRESDAVQNDGNKEENREAEKDESRQSGDRVKESGGEAEGREKGEDGSKETMDRREEEECRERDGSGEDEELQLSIPPGLTEHGNQQGDQAEAHAKKETENSASQLGASARPVPAPRRVFGPTPPRPAPRTRPPRVKDSPIINGDPVSGACAGDPGNPPDPSRITSAPTERSLSPGSSSQSCGTHKPKDPPWMALVHPGPWRKLPPAPPAHMTSLPRSGTVPSSSGWGSRLAASTNPFEIEEKADEEAEEEAGPVSILGPPSVVAKHPWYGISGAAKAASMDSPTRAASTACPANKGSPTHAASPANRVSQTHTATPASAASPADNVSPTRTANSSSPKSKKRRAPAVPQSSSTDCSYSKCLPDSQSHPFPKSVSEPAIGASAISSSNHEPEQPASASPPHQSASSSSSPMAAESTGSVCFNCVGSPPPMPLSIPSSPSTPSLLLIQSPSSIHHSISIPSLLSIHNAPSIPCSLSFPNPSSAPHSVSIPSFLPVPNSRSVPSSLLVPNYSSVPHAVSIPSLVSIPNPPLIPANSMSVPNPSSVPSSIPNQSSIPHSVSIPSLLSMPNSQFIPSPLSVPNPSSILHSVSIPNLLSVPNYPLVPSSLSFPNSSSIPGCVSTAGLSSVPNSLSMSRSISIPSLPSALNAPMEVGASPPAPSQFKRACKKNPFNQKASPSYTSPKSSSCEGPCSTRPRAPGHGFPLIKRKVQSDQFVPVEDIQMEMAELERRLDQLELRGVELERRLRHCQDGEEEETMLVDWFTLIHEKHMLVRREAELVYTAKQQNLEERQADVEYELRCLLNKPETEWIKDDRDREQQLMIELVTIIEERNQIINSMDQDKQREEVEDKLLAAMIKRKDFHRETDSAQRKRAGMFKALKVLKMLSHKTEGGKSKSHHKGKR
ncbi:MICAL-like protein 1 [Megalops cyprinoides]|uniref:MICAL-like protein 1 n=1 Tax=Megalops cyprinoides TaxID=118141 RepID=UPI001864BF80|nr:MICAL-like protein 1 [Megalops cyprinoides]